MRDNGTLRMLQTCHWLERLGIIILNDFNIGVAVIVRGCLGGGEGHGRGLSLPRPLRHGAAVRRDRVMRDNFKHTPQGVLFECAG